MNYYPFHIGDYAAHTAHLSWEEDIAYRRMLDWYYLNERPLPIEPAKIARLIRMPKSLDSIAAVLEEFFLLTEEGFRNRRADAEISVMTAKQELQQTKGAHETDRMRRHRERRSEMFSALREVGVVPAWDIPIKDLQRLFNETCNAPATHLQREQVVTGNAPATAIPTPTPTPTPKEEKKKTAPDGDLLKGIEPKIARDFRALRTKLRAPITETAMAGIAREAQKAGLSVQEALAVCCERGWRGFKAEWMAGRNGSHLPAGDSVPDFMRGAI